MLLPPAEIPPTWTPGSTDVLFDLRGKRCCFFVFFETSPFINTCVCSSTLFILLQPPSLTCCIVLIHISLLVLTPFIIPHSLSSVRTLVLMRPHAPLAPIDLILGCLSSFSTLTRAPFSPPLLHYSPLPISGPIPVFLVSG